MSSISKCPQCKQEVTVPDGLASDAEVRCPLCDAEYPLADALAEAPPALIPVGSGAIKFTEAAPAKEDSPVIAAPPGMDFEQKSETESESDAIDTEEETEKPSIATEAAEDDELDEVSAMPSFGDAGPSSAEADVSFSEMAAATVSSGPPKKRKQKSPLRHIIETVLGGVVGLLIAYYALFWLVPRDKFDLPELPLPFLPHTTGSDDGDDDDQAKKDDAVAGKDEQSPEDNNDQSSGGANRPADDPSASPDPSEKPDSDKPEDKPDDDPADEPKDGQFEDPVPLSGDYVGPIDRPSFTTREYGQALKEVDAALKKEAADNRVSAETYDLLCKAAHIDAMVQDNEGDPQHGNRKMACKKMLDDLARNPDQMFAAVRLTDEKIGGEDIPEGGILVAGVLSAYKKAGNLHAGYVKPIVSDKPILVLSDHDFGAKKDEQVLLLGTIMKNPDTTVAGYTPARPREWGVWVGTAVKVDN